MKRCPDCRRAVATEADWAAFGASDAGACHDETCCWGGDRCWYDAGCGFRATGVGPGSIRDLAGRGRALRGRKPWSQITHSAAHPA